MNNADLELIYEDLARAIDGIKDGKTELFLAKVALLLAKQLDNPDQVRAHIEAAAANLDA